jgi:hypothetical protein
MYTRVSINLLKQVHATAHPGVGLSLRATPASRDGAAEAELMAALSEEAGDDADV